MLKPVINEKAVMSVAAKIIALRPGKASGKNAIATGMASGQMGTGWSDMPGDRAQNRDAATVTDRTVILIPRRMLINDTPRK